MISKRVVAIVLMIIPLFVCIGFLRYQFVGVSENDIFPLPSRLVYQFQNMPDFASDLIGDYYYMQDIFNSIEWGDISLFGDNLSSWFVGVGYGFKLIYDVVAIPIKFIVWFFTALVGVNPVIL